jgi:3-oxoadipate enol-lactonase
VLAHSLGTDLRMFDRLVDRLPGVRVIRYDLRGHGLSAAPPGEYWMGDLVADAAAIVETLAGGRAIFAGISIGGVIAQGLAAERPDLLARARADEHGRQDRHARPLGRARRGRARGGVETLADAVLERWFPAAFRAENADEVEGWRAMLVRTPVDGYAGCAAALPNATCATRPPACGCRPS